MKGWRRGFAGPLPEKTKAADCSAAFAVPPAKQMSYWPTDDTMTASPFSMETQRPAWNEA